VSPEAPFAPSPFFETHLLLLRDAARRGPVAALACGRGRHALAAARAGLSTLAVDRNADFLGALQEQAREQRLPLQCLRFDLEAGLEIPFLPASCGAVLVFRFLYRPLAPAIERLLAPGGWLLYETFTTGQRERGGHPCNPAFLLEPQELRGLFPGLEVRAYDEGARDGDVTARLLARKPGGA
jgi:SAM-dependent methyltransferase